MIRPIGMAEMNLVFEVTDSLGLHRESLQVSLAPSGDGSVERGANGKFHIVLPETRPLLEWLPTLRALLEEKAGT